MADASAREALEWEETYRSRTAIATIAGGNLVLFGGIALGLVLDGAPKAGVLDALRSAAGEKLRIGPGLRTGALQFYDDRAVQLVLAYFVQALGAFATAAMLGYLFRATKARRPEFPRAALYTAVVGPVMLGVGLLAVGLSFAISAHDFVSKGVLTTKAAHDAFGGAGLLGAQVIHTAAGLAVAFAFVLVSLNAMRVGLLTRFMGVLGVIAGALFVFPLGSSFVVQGFWMIAFGFMLLGRWPNGRPPAWQTGQAEPWPTQQQLREARDAQAGSTATPAPASSPVLPAAEAGDEPSKAHSSSKKKKRKRR